MYVRTKNSLFLFCLLIAVSFVPFFAFAEDAASGETSEVKVATNDPVLVALSARHFTQTQEELEALAGGKDAFVGKLLAIRKMSGVSFAPVRAAKLLLSYTDRPEVRKALESDLQSEQLAGLAQVVTLHIDKIENPEFRTHIARIALSRASRDADFQPYARALIDSADPQVRKLAREKFN
jgi:hypothetical protein